MIDMLLSQFLQQTSSNLADTAISEKVNSPWKRAVLSPLATVLIGGVLGKLLKDVFEKTPETAPQPKPFPTEAESQRFLDAATLLKPQP